MYRLATVYCIIGSFFLSYPSLAISPEKSRKAFLRQCLQRRKPAMGGMRKLLYAPFENLNLTCEEIADRLHEECYKESQKVKREMEQIHTYIGCMHNNKDLQ